MFERMILCILKKKQPMCRMSGDDRDVPNSKEIFVRGLAGELIRTTVYEDGSKIYHYGGPVGSGYYDKFGDEC